MKFSTFTVCSLILCSVPFLSAQSTTKKAKKVTKKGQAASTAKLSVPSTPPLPGILNDGKKVILAQDIDYPPYTGIDESLNLSGFGVDFAKGLEEVCDLDVVVIQASWGDCWSNKIGVGLSTGYYHGCTTYTNTRGIRNRYLEFSAPILADNKPAGILTRLEGGVPVVDGASSLEGVKVGDVLGWAPTSDVLVTSTNLCTMEKFTGFTMILPEVDGNDAALKMLLDGDVDALWIYADQAEDYASACANDPNQVWDCSLWSKFKTDFAYVQTGIYDYMNSGTTLAISKLGSGLASSLDPCIEAFIKTKSYKDLCVEYDLESSCFENEFFDTVGDAVTSPTKLATKELTTACSDGYCPCP